MTQTWDPVAYINEPRWQESRLGLERIQDLLERLGRPQDRLHFVHVAGTNGKGSTCAYIAQIMQCAGYKTGLFTSPYIETFEERIRVNGENITMDELSSATLEVKEKAEEQAAETGDHPTEFELMWAVALVHFARVGCEIVVAEVGLGGRFDATNVIENPEVCVITRIGLDHTSLLGDTVEAIAREKAGIVKPGSRVISWPQETEAMMAIREICREQGAELTTVLTPRVDAGRVTRDGEWENAAGELLTGQPQRKFLLAENAGVICLTTRLLGSYQPSNAYMAICAVRALAAAGWDRLTDEAVREGVATTSWPGRFELVSESPAIFVDGGHNPQGAQVLVESLENVLPDHRVVFLMGVLADKDYPDMIRTVLPKAQAFVTVAPPVPRKLDAANLAQEIRAIMSEAGAVEEDAAEGAESSEGAVAEGAAAEIPVCVGESFADGLDRALELAGSEGVVCAFGSLYSVSCVKDAVRKKLS